MARVVLASTSRHRRALLDRLGLEYDVVAPGVDESLAKAEGLDPEVLVRRLAREKAEAVHARRADAIVIGSDQCAAIDGRILDKPGTAERAVDQLALLSGRTHRLLTAVHVIGPRVHVHLDEHRLTMRALERAEIERYVARDAPLDCAGAYKIESLGVSLFERVEGEDATAIVGLPLIALCRILRAAGVALP